MKGYAASVLASSKPTAVTATRDLREDGHLEAALDSPFIRSSTQPHFLVAMRAASAAASLTTAGYHDSRGACSAKQEW